MKKNLMALLILAATMAPGEAAQADYNAGTVTEYYTMVNRAKIARHCATEGNQIVNGQLIGSDCRPVRKYCRWGIGARGMCIRPCRDGAGARSRLGQTARVRPFICPWGPDKGKLITSVRIADVGGAVRGSHVDVFKGLCRVERGGVCKQYEPDDFMVAEYGGHSRDTEYAELEDTRRTLTRPETNVDERRPVPIPIRPVQMATLPEISDYYGSTTTR